MAQCDSCPALGGRTEARNNQSVAAERLVNIMLRFNRSTGVTQQCHGLSHGLAAGLFVLRHLDEWNEMRRIPEMRADHPFAMNEMPANFS